MSTDARAHAWAGFRAARAAMEAAQPMAAERLGLLELGLRARVERLDGEVPAELVAALEALPSEVRIDVLELISSNVPATPELARVVKEVVDLPDPDADPVQGQPAVGLFSRRVMAVWAGVDAHASGFGAMARMDRYRGLGRLVAAGWPGAAGLEGAVAFARALGPDELGAAVMAWLGTRGYSGESDVIHAIEAIERAGMRLEAMELALIAAHAGSVEVSAEVATRWLATAEEAAKHVDDVTGQIVVGARRAALLARSGKPVVSELVALSERVAREKDPFFVAAVWKTLARAAAVAGIDAWDAVVSRMARETRGLKEREAWEVAKADVVRALPRLARHEGAIDRGREAVLQLLGRQGEPWLGLLLEVMTARGIAMTPGRSVEAALTGIEARLSSQGLPRPVEHVSLDEIAQTLAAVDAARAQRIGEHLPHPMMRLLWFAAIVTAPEGSA